MNAADNQVKKPKLPLTLPVKTFIRWALVVIVFFAILGSWLANTLVAVKLEDKVREVKERTNLQASNRAELVSEWLQGQLNLADTLASSDLVRLFSSEIGPVLAQQDQNENSQRNLHSALMAQKPYMQRTLEDFVQRNSMIGAYLINPNGVAFLTTRSAVEFSPQQKAGINAVFNSGQQAVLNARHVDGQLLLDFVKPVMELEDEDKAPLITAVFMYTVPLGDKLSELLDIGSLAQDGERAFMLQQVDLGDLLLIQPAKIRSLETEIDFITVAAEADHPVTSPIDEDQVFAAFAPVAKSPLWVLHEYTAKEALAFMEVYSKGIYGMVSLAMLALVSLCLLLVGHLLAQRNRNRVQHQAKTMEALVRAVEIRDPYLAGHHIKVARMAVGIGNDLGYAVRERSTLFYAAQLSGIGKIFVDQALLTKTGKLTKKERELVEGHVNHAMNVLKDIEFDLPIAETIEQMYEKLDGSGYPNKLEGAAISRMARVLGVCDAYVAMTAPRSYRDALKPEDALKFFKDNLDKYDSRVVTALEKRVIK